MRFSYSLWLTCGLVCNGADCDILQCMKLIDITGQKFGRLTVIRRAEKNTLRNQPQWKCSCECGNTRIVVGGNLRNGHTTSCGCYHRDVMTIHGNSPRSGATPAYHSWQGMIQRCTNPNTKQYHDYGGRGITVCERWLTFENFFKDMGERPVELSIDRIDNSLGYSPDNCRWATRAEQVKTRRVRKDSRFLEIRL